VHLDLINIKRRADMTFNEGHFLQGATVRSYCYPAMLSLHYHVYSEQKTTNPAFTALIWTLEV